MNIKEIVYNSLKENFPDTKTIVSEFYEVLKETENYQGTVEEVRQQFKLGIIEWLNEI